MLQARDVTYTINGSTLVAGVDVERTARAAWWR